MTTRMGLEPTRAEHIGLAVQRLNHSATSSVVNRLSQSQPMVTVWLYMMKSGKGAGSHQKSGVGTNPTNSAFNAV